MEPPDLPIDPIPTQELDPAGFPKRGSHYADIVRLAYSFDGYAHYGMETCAKLANGALSTYYHHEIVPQDLTELRACLFFEVRRWTLYEQAPDTKAMIYIFALIDALATQLNSVNRAS